MGSNGWGYPLFGMVYGICFLLALFCIGRWIGLVWTVECGIAVVLLSACERKGKGKGKGKGVLDGSFIAERGDVEEELMVSIDTTCGIDLLVKHSYCGSPSNFCTQGSWTLRLFNVVCTYYHAYSD